MGMQMIRSAITASPSSLPCSDTEAAESPPLCFHSSSSRRSLALCWMHPPELVEDQDEVQQQWQNYQQHWQHVKHPTLLSKEHSTRTASSSPPSPTSSSRTWVPRKLVTKHEDGGRLLDRHSLQVDRAVEILSRWRDLDLDLSRSRLKFGFGFGFAEISALVNLLEHGPLKVSHPRLFSFQQTWKKMIRMRNCPLNPSTISTIDWSNPTLKL